MGLIVFLDIFFKKVFAHYKCMETNNHFDMANLDPRLSGRICVGDQ